MRLRSVDVSAQSRASAETLYRLLADGSTWPRWSPMESFELERPGDPPPEGVGAIRVFRKGRTTGRDEILELVRNRRFRYANLSGVQVRDYVAAVELTPVADGTTSIRWQATFTPAVPGTGAVAERSIRRLLRQCVSGLADHASESENERTTA
jgi:hypothetical protein